MAATEANTRLITMPSVPLFTGTPPYSALFEMPNRGSAFEGEPMTGSWWFRVCDTAGFDVGLIRWLRLYLLPR